MEVSKSNIMWGMRVQHQVVRGGDMINDKKKKPWCDHCKKFCHTKRGLLEDTWLTIGRKEKKPERACQTMAEDSSETQISSAQLPFIRIKWSNSWNYFSPLKFPLPLPLQNLLVLLPKMVIFLLFSVPNQIIPQS